MANDQELSWEPVRRGGVYCSPACGNGCTWPEYQEATTAAEKLCGILGDGWKPRVWENLGWHYEAHSPDGRLKVSPLTGGDGYIALLGRPDEPGGKWSGIGETPQAAAYAAFNELLDDLGLSKETAEAIAAFSNQLRLVANQPALEIAGCSTA